MSRTFGQRKADLIKVIAEARIAEFKKRRVRALKIKLDAMLSSKTIASEEKIRKSGYTLIVRREHEGARP